MTTRPIVVGTDGSEESLRAVEWAVREAERRMLPLRIVSVPAMPPGMRVCEPAATVTNALRGIAGRALGKAVTRAEQIAPGLLVATDLLSGPPAPAVAAAGSGASMLVVGARGTGGFAAMVLGSVSRYAVTHAPCPVVVVREESTGLRREVVVGIRDPENASRALAFAFEEAALRNAELVAVHAWVAAALPIWVGAGAAGQADPAEISAEAADRLTGSLSGWQDKYPDVRVRQNVVNAHPAVMLCSYSARADLVVLGGYGALGATVHGTESIQHMVLNHACGPIAVVPSGRESLPS
jgi:nucleotide-binding universal stress UspA family protein